MCIKKWKLSLSIRIQTQFLWMRVQYSYWTTKEKQPHTTAPTPGQIHPTQNQCEKSSWMKSPEHQDRRLHIIHSLPEKWHTTGMCPQPLLFHNLALPHCVYTLPCYHLYQCPSLILYIFLLLILSFVLFVLHFLHIMSVYILFLAA